MSGEVTGLARGGTGRRVRGRLARDAAAPPTVQMTLISPVAGRVVRLLPAVALLLCALVVARGSAAWLIAFAGAAVVTWRPHLPVPAASALLVGMWVFAQGDLLAAPTPGSSGQGGLLVVAALVLGLHLLLRLTALAAHTSWRGVVERPVLGRVLRSVLGAQLAAQALVLAVVWLRSGVGAAVAGQGWLRLVAVAAAVAVALLVVPREWLVRPRGDDG